MWEASRQWVLVACREVVENRELGDRSGRVGPAGQADAPSIEAPKFGCSLEQPERCLCSGQGRGTR